jgi:UDP-2,3-diacylglucosamine pyrophosphatase LpxH
MHGGAMDKPFVDTLILSDLHLGSETSRAKDASRLLKCVSFRRLILLGDIFADLNFARLKREHWQFLGQVRKLSNPKRGVEVVWVEGNHDRGLAQLMSHLVGVKVYQEYAWTYDGRRHLAIHGHQFDSFTVNSIVLCGLGAWFYLQIQKLDSKHKRFARFLDRLNTAWLRLSPKVAEGALAHAKVRGAERVFCGHTHEQMAAHRNGIRYYNCGAWTNAHPTYVTIDDSGVQIHTWLELLDPEPIDRSDELTAADADFADTAC